LYTKLFSGAISFIICFKDILGQQPKFLSGQMNCTAIFFPKGLPCVGRTVQVISLLIWYIGTLVHTGLG